MPRIPILRHIPNPITGIHELNPLIRAIESGNNSIFDGLSPADVTSKIARLVTNSGGNITAYLPAERGSFFISPAGWNIILKPDVVALLICFCYDSVKKKIFLRIITINLTSAGDYELGENKVRSRDLYHTRFTGGAFQTDRTTFPYVGIAKSGFDRIFGGKPPTPPNVFGNSGVIIFKTDLDNLRATSPLPFKGIAFRVGSDAISKKIYLFLDVYAGTPSTIVKTWSTFSSSPGGGIDCPPIFHCP